jgi:hypothetical protein
VILFKGDDCASGILVQIVLDQLGDQVVAVKIEKVVPKARNPVRLGDELAFDASMVSLQCCGALHCSTVIAVVDGGPSLRVRHWAERALGRSANYEAVDHFQNALAIAEHLPEGPGRQKEVIEVTLKLGEAVFAAGRVSDSVAKFKLTAQLAREAGDTKAFIRSALGFDVAQFLSAKPLAESLQLLTEAMGKIDPKDQRSRCQLVSRLSRA